MAELHTVVYMYKNNEMTDNLFIADKHTVGERLWRPEDHIRRALMTIKYQLIWQTTKHFTFLQQL